ncbi:MAG: hypothetical protein KatS3mg036_0351 [Ignavibacterium sp.]|uniref:tail fiber domain-containing protein n=1 Tax=Ignavibacterium sp. TaxID=2651167 RepID=UPI0021DCD835|nr:tail fiber domain-containing protein [Ignavibacterium sp.]BDQ03650.1 MAG: hypothetical protein KatS3mg037_2225 [Ignavibacterium sp.]GIV45533.1 MAG: hypothetical protein KatS3mg036_0351 [Ignavibacterium sp.]
MKLKIFSIIFCALLFICEIFSQGIPQTINFQGVLKDASGNIVSNGDYNLTFKIYNAETGGTAQWTETKLVNVVDGIFSTQLGSATPINLPFDAAYWLGITVSGGSELTPRVAFSSVPYSRMSLTVPDNSLTASKIQTGQLVKSINGLKDSINLVAGSNVTITPSGNDITISAANGAGGTVTQVNTGSGLTGGPITTTGTISIANDGITNSMLQNNSVTSTKIADGSVTVNDLSDSSVTSAKIVDGTVSTSDLANNSVTTDKVVDGTITATDIANTQVVKSINSLKDNVNLVAGSNVTITPSGQNLTISASGGGGGTVTQVNTGAGLTGGPITTTGTISIANDGITNAMLQNNSVTSTKIADGTIVEADLGNNSVTSVKILDATITSADITDNAITSAKILNDAVTTTKILNGTILFEDIGTNGATANQVIKRNASNTAWITAPDETGADYSWNLTGNAGTTPGTNFIGTTDAKAFDIRTNNILRTRITTKGQIETYNTGLSVFVGQGAGANDDLSSNENVFVGFNSGSLNTTGGYNTAAGYQSLYSNTTGYDNTAIGYMSLYSNITGVDNTANGFKALYSNTTGYYNTANGFTALYYNTTGYDNTANGFRALYYNTTGGYNTASGSYSLNDITTQDHNTAIGFSAGDDYTFSEGTFVGSNAYPNASGYTNCMGLGYQARPTGSNRVHIGNSSITWIGGQVNWSTYSDGRYKKNVREDVRGLDFIMKLRPVTYNVAVNEISAFLKEDQKRDKDGNITFEPDEIDRKSREEKEAIRYTGFIAQEVEQAATELGFEFSGVEKPKDENNLYSLRYAEFVVPLVKAIQEQQKIIEDLTRRIEALERK